MYAELYRERLQDTDSQDLLQVALEFAFDQAFQEAKEVSDSLDATIYTGKDTDGSENSGNLHDREILSLNKRIYSLSNGYALAALRSEPYMRPTTNILKQVFMILLTVATKLANIDPSREKVNIQAITEVFVELESFLQKTS